MFKRWFFLLFARLCGVHLVKFRPETGLRSQLAVAMKHPLTEICQDIAVLHPLEIKTQITLRELGNRPMKNTFEGYLAMIYNAAALMRAHRANLKNR